MIERHFNIPFVAGLALREKQIQQNYRPVIAVHKWFARRPGTLFRALILSEFTDRPVIENFYQSHHMPEFRVFDPFMGGGTTMMEANRIGCSVIGADVNPMAWWIVRQELLDLDVDAYTKTAARLRAHLEAEIGHLYRTGCAQCGSTEAHVKYFLWVKTSACSSCGQDHDGAQVIGCVFRTWFPGWIDPMRIEFFGHRRPKRLACGQWRVVEHSGKVCQSETLLHTAFRDTP